MGAPSSSWKASDRCRPADPDGARVEKLRVPYPDARGPRGDPPRACGAAGGEALVGFCGGPFTVACYLVEGRGSREFLRARELMFREPDVWHALVGRLADAFAGYVAAQVTAGADVIQVFDSWAGLLSPAAYAEFAAPYSARVLDAVEAPTIHFGTGTAGILSHMRDAGGDVIGLDWRVALDRGWAAIGLDRGVQGNLDPAVLLGPWERVEGAARTCSRRRAAAWPCVQPRPRRAAGDRSRTLLDAPRGARAGGDSVSAI